MGDWLKVTDSDIAAVERRGGERLSADRVLRLTPDDLAPPARMIVAADDGAARPDAAPRLDVAALEKELWSAINADRRRHLPRWLGRRRLRWDPAVAAAARAHAEDMARRGYVAHETPEGKRVADRLRLARIPFVACGENIGLAVDNASPTARVVHDIQAAFMNEPRRLFNHRGNILNPIWTQVGVGVAVRDDGGLLVTQTFVAAWRGRRPAAPPALNAGTER